jgi:hypothetical protein
MDTPSFSLVFSRCSSTTNEVDAIAANTFDTGAGRKRLANDVGICYNDDSHTSKTADKTLSHALVI